MKLDCRYKFDSILDLNMIKFLYIKITDTHYTYGEYKISEFFVKEASPFSNTKNKNIKLDSAFVHYLIKELKICNFYRKSFVWNWVPSLQFILKETTYDLIDYKWNKYVYTMVRERCELDHALSWLSTLGGAFSALGEYLNFLYLLIKLFI